MDRRRSTRLTIAALAVLAACVTSAPGALADPPDDPGGVPELLFVARPDGAPAPGDAFASKLEVYLGARPADGQPVDQLPDGDYVFQVSRPDGTLLLSADRPLCRLFRVEDGTIARLRDLRWVGLQDHEPGGIDGCHVDDDAPGLAGPTGRHDTNDAGVAGLFVQLMPFNDTDDPAGYYKLSALPLEMYLKYGGRLLRAPQPVGAGFDPDPGFLKAKAVLYDFFRIGVPGENQPPIADAGPGRSFALGESVTLDGTGSSDPDGDPLSFAWTLTRPAGSAAAFDDPASATPTLAPDLPGTYVATLVVSDGALESTPDMALIVSANAPPVADAGPDRTVAVGGSVVLDGSGSSDPDGDYLTFSWSFVEPAGGAGAQLDDPQSPAPTLTVSAPGPYVLQLVVSDGMLDSAPDTATVSTESANTPPVADAGPDRTFAPGETVTLDGSGSTDADGDPLTFAWSLDPPAGSAAALDDATSPMPSFAPDLPGDYLATLVVHDGIDASAPDTATISSENSPPVADAGPDRVAEVGGTTTLDGSGSSDVDGDPLTYLWRFVDPELAEEAILDDPTAVQPQLTVLGPYDYALELVVNDGELDSEPDVVLVTTANRAPLADAGPDRAAHLGETVTLDGSGSSDPDFDFLTYSWSLTAPAGSAAALSAPTSPFPSFALDVPGIYIAQLIVSDGELSSAPDTATVTTLNAPPVADAGPDVTVAPGGTAILDGSGSSDPEGAPLTYAWALLSRPAGSAAALADATEPIASLPVDLPGTYVAQLIVSDGEASSAPDTVTISTANVAPVADAGEDFSVPAGTLVTLDAGASTDADGDPLTFAWSIASRPAGSSATLDDPQSATPRFVADRPGIFVVQLVASDGALDSAPATVRVTAEPDRRLRLELDSTLLGIDRTVAGRVVALEPAPPGGLSVALSSDDEAVVTIAPPAVTIPEGETTAPLAATGVALGGTTLRAEAPDWFSAARGVEVTTFLVSVDLDLTLAPGQTQGLPTSLSSPAPAGGLTVFLTSEDPAIATVTPSVFVPEGAQTPAANPQVTGGAIGATRVVASAEGYAPATADVTVTLTLDFPADALVLPLETRPYRLNLSAAAPPGGLELTLSIADPSIASVPATLVVPGGVATADVPVTGLADGVTALTATADGVQPATGTVEVRSGIQVNADVVGRDLQRGFSVSLHAPAPPGGRTIALTSADPSRLLLSGSADEPGGETVAVVVSGGDHAAQFWVQALDGAGEVDVTAVAEAHVPGTGTFPLRAAGFAFLPQPLGGFTISTQDRDVPLTLRAHALQPGSLGLDDAMPLRAGVEVEVGVANSDPSVIALSGVPVAFAGDERDREFLTNPVGAGAATLTVVQPAGFETPASRSSLVATVFVPSLDLGGSATYRLVGYRLQQSWGVGLAEPPAEPVEIALTVDDPSVLLIAPNAYDAPGASTLTLTGVTGFNAPFRVHGLVEGASTVVRAEAQGYEPAEVAIDVVGSGFRFRAPVPAGTTTTLSNARVAALEPVMLHPQSALLSAKQLIPGETPLVEVVSSDPAVLEVLDSPVLVSNEVNPQVSVAPAGAGTATVSIVQPPGFTPPPSATSFTLNVSAPSFSISGAPSTGPVPVGRGFRTRYAAQLHATPPSPRDVTLTIGDPSIATIGVAPGGAAADTLVFPDVAGGSLPQYDLVGLAEGTTTLTVAAEGYAPLVREIAVQPAGFAWGSPGDLTATTFDTTRVSSVYAFLVDAATGQATYPGNLYVPLGPPLAIEVLSSNPGIAAVLNSPLSFAPGAERADAHVDPLTAGTVELSIVQPPGYADSERAVRTMIVDAPDVQYVQASAVVGDELQTSWLVRLEVAPPNPVDVTIVSAAPGTVTLSADRTAAGGSSVTFANVTTTTVGTIWVQGRDLGATEVRGQAAGFDDAVRTVFVRPSGFVHEPPHPVNAYLGLTTTRRVRSAVLGESDLTVGGFQEVRGGLDVEAVVTSGDPSIATVEEALIPFAGGDPNAGTYTILPQAEGSTTLTVEPVAGFATPSENRVREVHVQQP